MAVIEQAVGTINFEVYLTDTSKKLGLATVELPNLERETIDMKGVSMGGTRAMPVRGNVGSAEVKLTWRSMTPGSSEFFLHETVRLSLYSAQQTYDGGTGVIRVPQHRIEISGVPKSINLGKFEVSATMDAETTLEVVTLYYYVDGVEKIGWEPFNYILRVSGEDEGEEVRGALGWL